MNLRKIINPWEKIEGFKCFGCSPQNPIGLHLCFYEDGDEVVGTWVPSDLYDGWIGTLHGGIQSLILDEVSSWTISRKIQLAGVTTKMEIRYKKPLSSTDGAIKISAKIDKQRRNIVVVEAVLMNATGEVCTEATCTYYTYPKGTGVHGMSFDHCYVEGEDEIG